MTFPPGPKMCSPALRRIVIPTKAKPRGWIRFPLFDGRILRLRCASLRMTAECCGDNLLPKTATQAKPSGGEIRIIFHSQKPGLSLMHHLSRVHRQTTTVMIKKIPTGGRQSMIAASSRSNHSILLYSEAFLYRRLQQMKVNPSQPSNVLYFQILGLLNVRIIPTNIAIVKTG